MPLTKVKPAANGTVTHNSNYLAFGGDIILYSQSKSCLVLKSDLSMLYKTMTQSILLTNVFTCKYHTIITNLVLPYSHSSLFPNASKNRTFTTKCFTCHTSLINRDSLSHIAQMQCQNSLMQWFKIPLVIIWSRHNRWYLSSILVPRDTHST